MAKKMCENYSYHNIKVQQDKHHIKIGEITSNKLTNRPNLFYTTVSLFVLEGLSPKKIFLMK